MESKPFEVQSPQAIAEEYGGNKQKIAQAMQAGLVDPTAGLLAGMFIDRMRGAAVMEQAPQRTVAQQVFAPPAPPQMPMPQQGMQVPPSAGLGALPPGAAPDIGALTPPPAEAAPAPEEAPMGMAEGGIAQLPVPDGMFDEPDNGGYGGGGLVAFAGGGTPGWATPDHWGPTYESIVLNAIPGTRVTSRQRSAAANAAANGVPNSFHMTNDARDFVPPPGMSMQDFVSRVNSIPALTKLGADVIYEGPGAKHSTGPHVHVEPGNGGGRRSGAPADSGLGALAAGMPNVPSYAKIYSDAERGASAEADKLFPGRGTTIDRIKDIANTGLSEETQRANAKQDKLEYLQEFFARLASTTSPHFMQAVGSAAAAALPGRAAARKARREEYMNNLKLLADAEGMSLEDAKAKVEYIRGRAKDAVDISDKQLGLASELFRANLQASTTLQAQQMQGESAANVANINLSKMPNMNATETLLTALNSPDPAVRANAEKLAKLLHPQGTTNFDPNSEFGLSPNTAPGGSGGTNYNGFSAQRVD